MIACIVLRGFVFLHNFILLLAESFKLHTRTIFEITKEFVRFCKIDAVFSRAINRVTVRVTCMDGDVNF